MPDGSAGGTQSSILRVATLNLLSPDHADWNRRRDVLRSGLQDLRPDVIALQETVWGNSDTTRQQTCWAATITWCGIRRASAYGVGAVLGSRWPVRSGG